jgi:hypothetical protein
MCQLIFVVLSQTNHKTGFPTEWMSRPKSITSKLLVRGAALIFCALVISNFTATLTRPAAWNSKSQTRPLGRIPPTVFCPSDFPQHEHSAWNRAPLTASLVKFEHQVQLIQCPRPVTLITVPNVSYFQGAFRQAAGRCMGIVELSASPIAIPDSDTDPTQSCLVECLREFCCVGFSLQRSAAGNQMCHLFRCFYHTPPRYWTSFTNRSDFEEPPLFLIKHRRVHPLFGNDQFSDDQVQPQRGVVRLSLRLIAPFGSIIYLDDNDVGHAVIEVGVFDGIVLATSVYTTMVNIRIQVKDTPTVLMSATVLAKDCVAVLTMPLSLFRPHVGSVVSIVASPANASAAKALIRSATGEYVVHRRATQRQLVAAYPMTPNASRCYGAAHLRRSTECCAGDIIVAQHKATTVNISATGTWDVASDLSAVGAMVVLHLVGASHSCWKLIEGFYGQYGQDGKARFTHLILQRRCSIASLLTQSDEVGGDLQFGFQEASPTGRRAFDSLKVDVPLRVALSDIMTLCGWGYGEEPQDYLGHLVATSSQSSGTNVVPILLSITAHRCMTCLMSLLENIAAFVYPCVIVLHINPDAWVPTLEETNQLTAIRAHWSTRILGVYVNHRPVAHETSLYLHFAHFANVAYMRDAHVSVAWSHVVFVQQNERFVKRGVVEYVRQFDASVDVPTQAGGVTFGHYTEFPARVYRSVDDMFHTARDVPSDRTFDTLFEETSTTSVMQRLSGNRELAYPAGPILVEGTFFSYALAMEVVLAAGFLPLRPPSRRELEKGQCPSEIVSEYALSMILRLMCHRPEVRCGERVSVLMWSNTFRNISGVLGPHLFYEVMESDVSRARCSPIGPPFAMKRFQELSEASKTVDRIAADLSRSDLYRDTSSQCNI